MSEPHYCYENKTFCSFNVELTEHNTLKSINCVILDKSINTAKSIRFVVKQENSKNESIETVNFKTELDMLYSFRNMISSDDIDFVIGYGVKTFSIPFIKLRYEKLTDKNDLFHYVECSWNFQGDIKHGLAFDEIPTIDIIKLIYEKYKNLKRFSLGSIVKRFLGREYAHKLDDRNTDADTLAYNENSLCIELYMKVADHIWIKEEYHQVQDSLGELIDKYLHCRASYEEAMENNYITKATIAMKVMIKMYKRILKDYGSPILDALDNIK